MSREVGKGDTQRPLSVPKEIYDENYDRIFGSTKPDFRYQPSSDPHFPRKSLFNKILGVFFRILS